MLTQKNTRRVSYEHDQPFPDAECPLRDCRHCNRLPVAETIPKTQFLLLTYLLTKKDNRRSSEPAVILLQCQKCFPAADVFLRLLVCIDFCRQPQQGFCSGKPANHPAAIGKCNFAAILIADFCDFFRKFRQFFLLEHQLLQLLHPYIGQYHQPIASTSGSPSLGLPS